MIPEWLSAPWVRFLGIGGLLLVADLALSDPEPRRIELAALGVPNADGEGVALPEERRAALLQARIEAEVLVREARRLGLDREDTIVRRRLVQKMRFLLDSRFAPSEPDVAALERWLAENTERYREPARRSLEHRFYSRDRRVDPQGDARAARELLESGGRATGDAFLHGRVLTSRSRDELARLFGATFADAAMTLPVGAWSGPIRSSYGEHLVLPTDHQAASLPAVRDIRGELRADLLADERERAQAAALAELVASYEITGE